MADGTQASAYDRLFITKCFFFLAGVLMCNLAIVTALYTLTWEAPFHRVLAQEKAAFGLTLNENLHQTMRFNGDKIYDTIFVRTGLEGVVYKALRDPDEADIAGSVVKDMKIFSRLLDNIFDYLLLVSHRAGYFAVSFTYVGCLILGVVVHGAIIRHRKRYGFGDTPLLMNVWARTTLAYAIPITIITWSLPFAMNPYLLTLSLSFCVMGVAVFAFSLPKIA